MKTSGVEAHSVEADAALSRGTRPRRRRFDPPRRASRGTGAAGRSPAASWVRRRPHPRHRRTPVDGAERGPGERFLRPRGSRAQEERRGRLAVRSRHAYYLERAGWLAVEDIGGDRHRLHARPRRRAVALSSSSGCSTTRAYGTRRHGLGRAASRARRPRARSEKNTAPGCDPPCVVREVGDFDGAVGGALARGRDTRVRSSRAHGGQ